MVSERAEIGCQPGVISITRLAGVDASTAASPANSLPIVINRKQR